MCSRKWLMVALVVCGLVSACSNYNTNLSLQTSTSTLTFVSPSSASIGSQGFTMTANGTGFATGALILWNGKPLTTTLVSSIQLTAPVPALGFARRYAAGRQVVGKGSPMSPRRDCVLPATAYAASRDLARHDGAPFCAAGHLQNL